MTKKPCNIFALGCVAYQAALDIQQELASLRSRNLIDDSLILLEHPHTYTLGRAAHQEHMLLSKTELQQRNITVVEANRGGDVTYHGPGQLVAYPILHLGIPDMEGKLPHVDYVGYLRRLEEVIIQSLRPFGISGERLTGYTGVWIKQEGMLGKVAAIGVHVNTFGVSTHGLALNVSPDLGLFSGIVPCGISDKPVTSIQSILGSQTPSMDEVRQSVISAFEDVFNVQCQEGVSGLDRFSLYGSPAGDDNRFMEHKHHRRHDQMS